jgi:hypothetical protein
VWRGFLRQSFGGATFTAWQTVAGKQTAPRLPDYNYRITLYVLEQYWEKMCNITINYKKNMKGHWGINHGVEPGINPQGD